MIVNDAKAVRALIHDTLIHNNAIFLLFCLQYFSNRAGKTSQVTNGFIVFRTIKVQ